MNERIGVVVGTTKVVSNMARVVNRRLHMWRKSLHLRLHKLHRLNMLIRPAQRSELIEIHIHTLMHILSRRLSIVSRLLRILAEVLHVRSSLWHLLVQLLHTRSGSWHLLAKILHVGRLLHILA